jgi:AraC-like DNA-binding protein
MAIQFQEFSPGDSLQPFIHRFWAGRFNVHGETEFGQSVVPNGCVELIIHLGDEHCMLLRGDEWRRSPDFTLIGVHIRQYEVRFSRPVDAFGIQFHPDGFLNIFGVPAAKVMAGYLDSVHVFDTSFTDFCSRMMEAQDNMQRIRTAEKYLSGMLTKNFRAYDFGARAAEVIRRRHGMLTQDELISEVPLSPRQLQRVFRSQYGMTPKEYMRIARLNAVQRYMLAGSVPDFSDITHACGFADQAHLIREFKSFAGSPPRSFTKQRHKFIVNV